jgi:probable O-glycosylation ligase (exosortase A-associated)
MRDLAVLAFLIGCIGISFWRPWLGVLCLAVFSYMNPHAYAWGFMTTFPAYQVLVVAVFIATLMTQDRQSIPRAWQIPAFFFLWAFFVLTTFNAVAQIPAWEKLQFVSKVYLPFLLTLILINTREKLHYLIIAIAVSFGLIAVKGGIWAVGSGFAHRVYGPMGTQFAGNNEFAVAVIMNIPLLILWLRETRNRWIRYGLMAAIPLSAAAAVSSWSRGAILTLAVTTLVLILHSKRKWIAVPLVIAAAYLGPDYLPEEWFQRMDTIQTYEEDESAMSRITIWTDGWNYALNHPLLGAGFEGWRYVTLSDWHSSYIEILAEHGFIAFFVWASLLFGTMLTLTRLKAITRGIAGLEWVQNYATMIRTSLIAYAVGTVFLGLSYWDIFYHLVFIAVLVKQFALQELTEHQRERRVRLPAYAATT